MPPLVDIRGKEPYQFDEKGYVPAALAATVICVRQGPVRSLEQRTIRAADLSLDPQGLGGALAMTMTASGTGEFVFTSNLELLVAQSNVVNYYRTADAADLATMRYPGEWKLAGGGIEAGETLEQTALRELQEEYLVSDAEVSGGGGYTLRPLGARQTRWIRGKSNLMVNFVAQASENPWLAALDVEGTNIRLQTLADEADASLASGEWAGLSQEEKGERSPEVHQLAWLPIETVVRVMQSSIAEGTFVNDWQRDEFARLGVEQRDPMSVTMASVLDLENLLSDGGWGEEVPTPWIICATKLLLELLCVCSYPVKNRAKIELNMGLFYGINANA